MKFYILTYLLIIALLSTESCSRKSTESVGRSVKKAQRVKLVSIALPEKNARFILGDDIAVSIEKPDTLQIDSVEVFFRGIKQGIYDGSDEFTFSTKGNNPGKAGLRIKVHFGSERSENDSHQVELLSDITPTQYKYKIVNTYPHDVGAYTQGLIFYEGWLYEGTGNYNQSTVRKVRLQNGEVIQSRNNATDIFGEGITIYKGKIYQLTYKSQICYVYDLNTLEEIQKYYYQNKEGWGLTNTNDELIMSDGTNTLYFLDPEMFTVKRQIEVYNDEGPVSDLNELEYINGKIFANRYYTDEIVIIDPKSGKEEGRVNLKGILPVQDRKQSTNVLNGIAWDRQENRLFITGKYWPRLFEIKIEPVR
jgi:glutamine cyclotransferase